MGEWNWQVNEGALQQAAAPLESSPGLTVGVLWDRRTSPCLSIGIRHMQKCVTYFRGQHSEDFNTSDWCFSEFLNAFCQNPTELYSI